MTKSQLIKLVQDFKPVFGNENHLRALALIKKIDKSEQIMKSVGKLQGELDALDEEISQDADYLRFLIESK